MAQARARRSTRPAKARPKPPSRAKARGPATRRTRSTQHDAELIGLGFIAVGVFLACVLWFGLSGGPVPDAAANVGGWAAYLLPVVLVPVGCSWSRGARSSPSALPARAGADHRSG